MYLPIIGAFLEATGVILEKKMLRSRKFDYRNYTVFGFLAIVLVMIPFIYFVWRMDAPAFELKNMGIFAFVVFASVFANLLIFYSLKREKIAEFEPTWLMQPLFTVILAAVFFSSERNLTLFILAFIASLALVVTHVKKHHLYFNRYLIAALLGNFFFAVELVASKLILEHYSPFSFYFLRCLFIFAIVFALYKPDFGKLDKKSGPMIATIAIIWVFYRAIIYYGYTSLGIIFTTILFTLSPVLMLVFAVIFFKERPTLKQIIANGVVLACVVLALIFK